MSATDHSISAGHVLTLNACGVHTPEAKVLHEPADLVDPRHLPQELRS